MKFTEDVYEGSILSVIEELGYIYVPAENINRESYKNPLYTEDLFASLVRINPDLSLDVIDSAIFKLENIDTGTLVQRNRQFMNWLHNGIEVTYRSEEHTSELQSRFDLVC